MTLFYFSTLEAGDCGKILFFKAGPKSQPVYRPLGVFIGKSKAASTSPIYQAVILSAAIDDVGHEYRHHVSDIEIYKPSFTSLISTLLHKLHSGIQLLIIYAVLSVAAIMTLVLFFAQH